MFLNCFISSLTVASALLLSTSALSAGVDTTIFDGRWVSACHGSGDQYAVIEITSKGTSMTTNVSRYIDAKCTQPDVLAKVKVIAIASYPIGSTATVMGEAQHIDVTPIRAEADGRAVPSHLMKSTGLSNVSYDLVLVSNGKLYRGRTGGGEGSTPQTRPTELDTVTFLIPK